MPDPMRARTSRSTAPVGVAVLALGLAACSGASGPGSPSGPAGTPTTSAPPAVSSPAASSSSAPVAGQDLPQCLLGDWTAPVSREFANLGLEQRSNHAVRSATGVLALHFAGDRTWRFTYRQVKLQLSAGSADVDGTVDGGWSLAGNALTTTTGTSAITAQLALGGLRVTAPSSLTDVLKNLPPNQVTVECSGSGLRFQLPAAQGGGTATFDRAA